MLRSALHLVPQKLVRTARRTVATGRPQVFRPKATPQPQPPQQPPIHPPGEQPPPVAEKLPSSLEAPPKGGLLGHLTPEQRKLLIDARIKFNRKRSPWILALVAAGYASAKNLLTYEKEQEYLKDHQALRNDLEMMVLAVTKETGPPEPSEVAKIRFTRMFFKYDPYASDFAVASKIVPMIVLAVDKMKNLAFSILPLPQLMRNPTLAVQAIEFGIVQPLLTLMIENNDHITAAHMDEMLSTQSSVLNWVREQIRGEHYSRHFTPIMLENVALATERLTPESQTLRRLFDTEMGALAFASTPAFRVYLEAIIAQAAKRPETVAYVLCSLSYWNNAGVIFDPESEHQVKQCLQDIIESSVNSQFQHRLAMQGLVNFKINHHPEIETELFYKIAPRAIDPEYKSQSSALVAAMGYSEPPSASNFFLRGCIVFPYATLRWLYHGYQSKMFFVNIKEWLRRSVVRGGVATVSLLSLWTFYLYIPIFRFEQVMHLRMRGEGQSPLASVEQTGREMLLLTAVQSALIFTAVRMVPFMAVPFVLAEGLEMMGLDWKQSSAQAKLRQEAIHKEKINSNLTEQAEFAPLDGQPPPRRIRYGEKQTVEGPVPQSQS